MGKKEVIDTPEKFAATMDRVREDAAEKAKKGELFTVNDVEESWYDMAKTVAFEGPWYHVVFRLAIAPVAVPFAILYLRFRFPYTLSMGIACAYKSILLKAKTGEKRKFRFAPLVWLQLNGFIRQIYCLVKAQGLTLHLAAGNHAMPLFKRAYKAGVRVGSDFPGFVGEMSKKDYGAFKTRDLTFFRAKLGRVFTDAVRNFIAEIIQATGDDQRLWVEIYISLAQILEPTWSQAKDGNVKWAYDEFVSPNGLKRGCHVVGNVRAATCAMMIGYSENMVKYSYGFGDHEAAVLWTKAGQLAKEIQSTQPSPETDAVNAAHLAEFCRLANDAGARIYAALVKADMEAEEKRRVAAEEKAKKDSAKRERKAAQKEEKAAQAARPLSDLPLEEVLKGRRGRFEITKCRASRKKPGGGKGYTIHDCDHGKYYRNMSAPMVLKALRDLFVEFKDGKEPIECIIPLNDVGWKANFKGKDYTDFYNEQTETYLEAHPGATDADKDKYKDCVRIIPDGQPLRS